MRVAAKFETTWHYVWGGRGVFGWISMMTQPLVARFVWRGAATRYGRDGTGPRRLASHPCAPANRRRDTQDGHAVTGRDRATDPSIPAWRPLHARGRRDAFASRGPGKNKTHWSCPRLVENHCLSLCIVFEHYGAFVAEGRMPADGIIKAVDISGDRMFSLAA
jgi:hypothetical protein